MHFRTLSFYGSCKHICIYGPTAKNVNVRVQYHGDWDGVSILGRSFSFGDCLYKPQLNGQLRVDTYRSRSLEPWLLTGIVNAYFRPQLVIPGRNANGENAAFSDIQHLKKRPRKEPLLCLQDKVTLFLWLPRHESLNDFLTFRS